jgi:hypothetical protein
VMAIQCPHCGHSYSVDSKQAADLTLQTPCRVCAVPFAPHLPDLAEDSTGAAYATTPQTEEAAAGNPDPEVIPPWETRTGCLDLKAYWATTSAILFHPGQSFRHWGPINDIEGVLLFLLIYGSAGQVLGNYWLKLLQLLVGESPASSLGSIDFILFVLKAPFIVLFSTFVASSIIHFLLFLTRAAREPWKQTFALLAYVSGALASLQVIPFLGLLLAPTWGLIACICGLRELPRTSTLRGRASLSLPFFLVLLVLFIFSMILVGAGLLILNQLDIPR